MAPQEHIIHGDNLRKGPWLEEEDEQLVSFISLFGERKWDFIATASGLRRSGKSCRLRWLNYLRPNLKRGQISDEEEQIIIQLHELWGNKWAKIARRLPGRTDNEIKNYWRTHLRKKMQPQEGLNNSKQELLCQKGDTSQYSWNFSTELNYKSVDEDINIGITTSSSSDQHEELSSFTYLNSPYENRLYDWMSSSSSSSGDHDHNQIAMELNHDHHHHHHKGCTCFDSCFCNYLNFNGDQDGGDFSILDHVGSLWDMS